MEISPTRWGTRLTRPNRGRVLPAKTGTGYGDRDPHYAKTGDGVGAGYNNHQSAPPPL